MTPLGQRWHIRRRRNSGQELVESLRTVTDELRAGASLRQALAATSRSVAGSPFAPLSTALAGGAPMVTCLRQAASASAASDLDLASALGILAVHAEAGGNPLPAVAAMADRMAERESARRESLALTTQARLGARVVLLLTPGFLALLVVSDPAAALGWLSDSQTRALMLAGGGLQAVGAFWVTATVSGAVGRPRWARKPLLRAIYSLACGRRDVPPETHAADAAETVAFALDAGLSPLAAMKEAAPYAGGDFGEAMRAAVGRAGVPVHQALSEATDRLGGQAHVRFCTALQSSATLGTPLAPALRQLSSEVRHALRMRLEEDVRRASVRALVPLGVLVLPAFVLTCLVPLLVGGLKGVTG